MCDAVARLHLLGTKQHTAMNNQRHLEFHERQTAAMQQLIDALCLTIPKNWRQARLELEVSYSPFTQTRAIQHRLTNPITSEGIGDFPHSLFAASTALHVVFTEYEQAWKRAVIELAYDTNGRFRQSKANYTYGP